MNRINTRTVSAFAAAITVTAAGVAQAAVSADFNSSGNVGLEDLQGYMASYIGGDQAADTNGDGSLSVQDFFTFLQQWITSYIKEAKQTESPSPISETSSSSLQSSNPRN